MKNDEIIIVALYIRVSTEEQAKHGYSLDSQKARLTEFAKQQKYKVYKIYVDEGKSARTKMNKRNGLLELLKDAEDKKFNKIIFWRLDRWFRNISDYYKIQDKLDKYEVDWECSDEEYNTSTSNGRLHLNIKLSIAQNESDQTSDRIKFNFDNMIKNKKAISGKKSLPFGYTIKEEEKNRTIIVDEDNRHIVIDALKHFGTYQSVRKSLIYINNKYNLELCYGALMKIYRSELFYGKYRNVENYCEAYITKEQYDENQKVITKNYKASKEKHEYIFSSLLTCPQCGNKLIGGFHSKNHKNGNKYKYYMYRCNKAKTNNLCTYKKCIYENTIEKYLIKNIENLIETEKEKFIVTNTKEKEKPLDTTKLQIKINKLVDLYLDNRIDKEKYSSEYDRLKNEIETANKKPKEKVRDLSIYDSLKSTNYLSLYKSLDNEQKRLFWRKYIEKIIIEKDLSYQVYLK